jgi:hypothetical protein
MGDGSSEEDVIILEPDLAHFFDAADVDEQFRGISTALVNVEQEIRPASDDGRLTMGFR